MKNHLMKITHLTVISKVMINQLFMLYYNYYAVQFVTLSYVTYDCNCDIGFFTEINGDFTVKINDGYYSIQN